MNVRRFAGPMVALVVLAMVAAACSKGSDTTSGATTGGGYDSGSGGDTASTSSGYSRGSGYGNGSEDSSSGDMKTVPVGSEQANFEGAKDVSSAKSVDLEANTEDGTNYFSPTVLTGKPGQTITVKVTDASTDVAHNFSVDGTDVNVDLDPSSTQTVKVTFPDSGSVTFFCEYHRASGMLGELKTA